MVSELDVSKYKELFISEAEEHIESMNNALVELEKDPDDIEIVNQIFRSAHTLKGMALTIGYEKISRLSHDIENVLDRVRRGELQVTQELIDTLFKSFDALEQLVSKGDVDIASIQNALSKIYEMEAEVKKVPMARAFKIAINLQEGSLYRGARAVRILRELGELGEIVEISPEMKDITEENFDYSFELVLKSSKGQEEIERFLRQNNDAQSFEVSQFEEDRQFVKDVQSVKVDLDTLNTILNLTGELIIDKIRLSEISSRHDVRELEEVSASLERLVSELQESVLKARMVPLNQVFSRFPRMMRDLAKEKGKELAFTMEGGEIELDRTVLDEISEPLVHLLRNALDHGIENPDEREKAGKERSGRVKLKAKRERGNVIIEVEDDGRGIDKDELKRTAVERGIVSEDELEGIEDVTTVLFKPGFSLAERVTVVSGRGIGLDIVRTKIESLGGSISIHSEKGKGSRFVLRLPQTLTIIRVLLVEVSEQVYAIPSRAVKEIISISRSDIKSMRGEEIILLRGEVVPVIRLADALRLGSKKKETLLVIVESGDVSAGIAVDSMLGEREILIKPLTGIARSELFSGATILSDGRVVLILDVPAVLGVS